MKNTEIIRPIEIFFVGDNPSDINFTMEALVEGKIKNNLQVISDETDMINYLRKMREYPSLIGPDLILLDLRDSSGVDIINNICDLIKGIPVIVITGFGAIKTAEKAIELGMQNYLVKGEFNSISLFRTINYVLRRHYLLAELQEEDVKQEQPKKEISSFNKLMVVSELYLIEHKKHSNEFSNYSDKECSYPLTFFKKNKINIQE